MMIASSPTIGAASSDYPAPKVMWLTICHQLQFLLHGKCSLNALMSYIFSLFDPSELKHSAQNKELQNRWVSIKAKVALGQ